MLILKIMVTQWIKYCIKERREFDSHHVLSTNVPYGQNSQRHCYKKSLSWEEKIKMKNDNKINHVPVLSEN